MTTLADILIRGACCLLSFQFRCPCQFLQSLVTRRLPLARVPMEEPMALAISEMLARMEARLMSGAGLTTTTLLLLCQGGQRR